LPPIFATSQRFRSRWQLGAPDFQAGSNAHSLLLLFVVVPHARTARAWDLSGRCRMQKRLRLVGQDMFLDGTLERG